MMRALMLCLLLCGCGPTQRDETYRRHIINIDGVDGRTMPVDGVFVPGATCE